MLIIIGLILSANSAQASTLTYGTGPIEIMLFSDFFCPPCQQLEDRIGDTLRNIIRGKVASVTFIPMPSDKRSIALSAHLISSSAGQPYSVFENNRQQMYEMARNNQITDAIVDRLVQAYFGKPELLPYWEVIEKRSNEYKVDSTPTCVIREPTGKVHVFKGLFGAQKALESFITH